MLGWEVIPRIPIGNLSISPHGIGIAVGYFVGATLMARRARRTGFNEDHAWNAAVVGVLGAIVGARLAYIIGHREQFRSAIEYLQIYKGGISLMGGLIGGFLAAYVYCRVRKLDFGRLADLGAPGLAIGTAIGRIGDLIIGDHLGKTTDGFWGWEYQGGELISSPPCDTSVYPSATGCIEPGMVVHQTALYDSIWSLVIFVILMRLDRKPRPKGFLVFTWAALYSIGRILTDLTRVDKTWYGTGLTGSQLTAVCALVISVFWLLILLKKPAVAAKPAPAGAPAAEDPVSPVPPVDAEVPEAAAVPVGSPAGEEPGTGPRTVATATEATSAEVVPPVPTPSPPVDDLPPVETPPTAPVEAVAVDIPPGPAEEIPPPVEEVPASAADESASALPLERPTGPLEEIPPPAPASPVDEVALAAVEETPLPAEEVPAAAVDDTAAAPIVEPPPPPLEAPPTPPAPDVPVDAPVVEDAAPPVVQDGGPPADEPAGSPRPVTEVLPAEPLTGTVPPTETEVSGEPAAPDAEPEERKDSQEP